jgi:hypothetical protein
LIRFSWKINKQLSLSKDVRGQFLKYDVNIDDSDLVNQEILSKVGYRGAFMPDISEFNIIRKNDLDECAAIIGTLGCNSYPMPKISATEVKIQFSKAPYGDEIQNGDEANEAYFQHMIEDQEDFFKSTLSESNMVTYEGLCRHIDKTWTVINFHEKRRFSSIVTLSVHVESSSSIEFKVPLSLLIVSLRLQEKACALLLHAFTWDTFFNDKWMNFLKENGGTMRSWPVIIPIEQTLDIEDMEMTINTAYHGFSETFVAPSFITSSYHLPCDLQIEPWFKGEKIANLGHRPYTFRSTLLKE